MTPAGLKGLPSTAGGAGTWVCEVGVGVVHCDAGCLSLLGPAPPPSPGIVDLHHRIKQNFDPSGRLNPGRHLLAGLKVVA